jgi:hypothetical protein
VQLIHSLNEGNQCAVNFNTKVLYVGSMKKEKSESEEKKIQCIFCVFFVFVGCNGSGDGFKSRMPYFSFFVGCHGNSSDLVE